MLKVLGALLAAAVLVAYVRGWRHLRAVGHEPPRWRLLLYLVGVVTAAGALIGLDEAAEESFSMHMTQHLLLVMVAAPLITLGNPLPQVLWGLPRGARAAIAGTLRPGARVRRVLAALTFMPVAGVNERVSRVENIRRWTIVPAEWTAESEELTPTLKLKRRVILEKYAVVIEELYR